MPNRSAIRGAILQGVRKANLDYEQWSRGLWVSDSGVEGLMVATIAGKLGSKLSEDESLMIECPFPCIKEWSKARPGPGRPRKTLAKSKRGSKRADIVLFNGNGRPTWVVEVKREWDRRKCFGDLERIRDLVLRYGPQNTGTLRGGFLAMMLVEQEVGDKQIRKQAKGIEETIKNKFLDKGLNLGCYLSDIRSAEFPENPSAPYWSHASLCIQIAGKNSNPA